MKLDRSKRNKIYKGFDHVYKKHVGIPFKFQKGEKGRVVNLFTQFCELSGVRDPDLFDEVYLEFAKYLISKTKEWLSWEHASRVNYIGFLDKPQSMSIFIKKTDSQETSIAGQTDEGWSF